MFHHVKELQFNARVSGPDPRFARLLLEQFGGANGELKAALQYFVQSFGVRQSHPEQYDMLMDIATEEFSHLEIVGATITMLLNGLTGDLKDTAEESDLVRLTRGSADKEEMIHEAMTNPHFFILSGGGPTVTDSVGVPWSGSYVTANGDPTVDLRSNMAAEGRAKIVYEYLIQFTDDPLVVETLSFLMTREIAHYQMFGAALETIQPNFPQGILQGNPKYGNSYFNLSNGASRAVEPGRERARRRVAVRGGSDPARDRNPRNAGPGDQGDPEEGRRSPEEERGAGQEAQQGDP